jgi:hypothetical protein
VQLQGWSNPELGSLKAGVVPSSSAEDGYNAVSSTGGAIQSSNIYSGKDKDGNVIKFQVHVSAAPGKDMMYVVNQVLVN